MKSVRKYHIEKNAAPTRNITMFAPEAVRELEEAHGHERESTSRVSTKTKAISSTARSRASRASCVEVHGVGRRVHDPVDRQPTARR